MNRFVLSMTILTLSGITLSGIAPTGIARAQQPPLQPVTQPASQPVVDVDQLIQQLGDPNFRTRELASKRLRDMGPAVLPKLEKARQSDDPEVQSRADAIVHDLTRPQPLAPPGEMDVGANNIIINGNGAVVQVRSSVRNINGVTTRSVTRVENGKKTELSENKDGIKITVTEPGNDQPTIYEAKTADELKQKSPEGFAIYKRMAIGAARPVMAPRVNANAVQILPPGAGVFRVEPRVTIAELKIDVEPAPDVLVAQLSPGVHVVAVDPTGRGQKIGLERFDLITKVNDKPVGSIPDLNKTLAGTEEADLTLQIYRKGKPQTLKTPPQN